MAKVKVFYETEKWVRIGPLGYFKRGDRLKVRSSEVVVVGADLDGMAAAYRVEYLETFGSVAKGLAIHKKVPAMPAAAITQVQAFQCQAIAAAGARMRERSDAKSAALGKA